MPLYSSNPWIQDAHEIWDSKDCLIKDLKDMLRDRNLIRDQSGRTFPYEEIMLNQLNEAIGNIEHRIKVLEENEREQLEFDFRMEA